MRYFVPGGAAAVLLLYFFMLVLLPIGPAHAQEPSAEGGTWFEVASLGGGGFLVLLLILAIVIVTALGWRAGGREGAWPHWAGLVKGLGEAAFLIGILSTIYGFSSAMSTVARMGATVTPADLADGISRATATLWVGGLAALIGLGGAGFVHLGQKKNSS